ncbi:MAG: hypothetical protein FJ088_10405 [Deltaproteobacteria bacterium]|nr:hypothetical protein [Deltaproteobacteria bacterium]
MFASINAYPFHMSYFNEIAGGKENGWKYLADSNIDWGQDIYFLAEDIEKQRNDDKNRVFYGNVFGTIRPEDAGIRLQPIPEKGLSCKGKKATVYLSVNKYLLKSALHPDGLYPWLLRIPFDRIIGSSIMVWDDICGSNGQKR